MSYEGLRFNYGDSLRELRSFQKLANRFLLDEDLWILEASIVDLNNARHARDKATWNINQETPIRTRVSRGEYRHGEANNNTPVFGELCFSWEIENPDKGARRQRHFVLNGLASTSLILRNADTSALVARWQFEAGDAASPGCHFHTATNQYQTDGLFPEWLKVPRFPGIIVFPFDALEFVLGELFQDEWLRNVSRSSHERNEWASAQRLRLHNVLTWQQAMVNGSALTPWMSLKKAKPDIDLFESS